MSATEKSKPEIVRKRKPAARRTELVVTSIEERLLMIPMDDGLEPHRVRLTELLDELRRSLGKKDSPESGEEG